MHLTLVSFLARPGLPIIDKISLGMDSHYPINPTITIRCYEIKVDGVVSLSIALSDLLQRQ